MAAEIQLLTCGYSAQCTVRGCRARATLASDDGPIFSAVSKHRSVI